MFQTQTLTATYGSYKAILPFNKNPEKTAPFTTAKPTITPADTFKKATKQDAFAIPRSTSNNRNGMIVEINLSAVKPEKLAALANAGIRLSTEQLGKYIGIELNRTPAILPLLTKITADSEKIEPLIRVLTQRPDFLTQQVEKIEKTPADYSKTAIENWTQEQTEALCEKLGITEEILQKQSANIFQLNGFRVTHLPKILTVLPNLPGFPIKNLREINTEKDLLRLGLIIPKQALNIKQAELTTKEMALQTERVSAACQTAIRLFTTNITAKLPEGGLLTARTQIIDKEPAIDSFADKAWQAIIKTTEGIPSIEAAKSLFTSIEKYSSSK